MKFTVLFPQLSCLLLLGAGTNIAQANGFFQENKDISPDILQNEQSPNFGDKSSGNKDNDDSYYLSQDDFILDQQNPHNFFNPYNQQPLSLRKTSEVEVNMDNSLLKSEIQEFDSELELKSEKAFRENRLNAKASLSEDEGQLPENKPKLLGIELSELTSSNLIVSAQKKKFIEKLLPALLSDSRIVFQDRQRLEFLLSQFEQDNKLDDVDELWLRQLVKDYHIQELDDFQKKF